MTWRAAAGAGKLARLLRHSAAIAAPQVAAVQGRRTASRGPVIIRVEEAFGGQPVARHPDP